jgi:C-terminal processing protease CtpA/Prc
MPSAPWHAQITRSNAVQPKPAGVSAMQHIYDEVWLLVYRNFLYQNRLNSWGAWRHKFDGQLTNLQETNRAVNAMLASLSDEYTFFRGQEETTARNLQDDEHHVVTYKRLRNGIGYISFSTFNSNHCVSEAKQALNSLNHSRALIVDLRNNGGGRIEDAFEVFALLGGKGRFVTMKGKTSTLGEEWLVDHNWCVAHDAMQSNKIARIFNLSGSKPMVVIVNHDTRSAAEMLAGALRDSRHATIVGERTFGKGVVQRIWEFDNGTSLKVTAAQFFLPAGAAIQNVGLVPDQIVKSSKFGDASLNKAIVLLKKRI